MNLSPPSTQKAGDRPISFVLDDGKTVTSVDLVIRPEDLTRADPSRLSVQQTLGPSPWADNFGPGITQINISGHTGWRRTEGSDGDGGERFQRLYDSVYKQWHAKRKAAAAAGDDPDRVQLIFSDVLDDISVVVAPTNFTLRRSRSRPLLFQYQIALTVIDPNVGQYWQMGGALGYLTRAGAAAGGGLLESLGLESLTASVNRITAMIGQARQFINSTILGPITKFMGQTARLYGAVRGAISAGLQTAGALIRVAQTITQAGVNIFRTLAAVASIPSLAKSMLMQVAGAYSNILCVLRNALRQKKYVQDYSDLYGSSNCSSTAGGRPISRLAGVNPFYNVVPTGGALPVSVSKSAQQSLVSLANADPVLAPMSVSTLGATVSQVTNGLVIA